MSLRALRNRQDLFQEEGILNLILDAIDKITVITAQGFMVALAGEEAGQDWDVISGVYYWCVAKTEVGRESEFVGKTKLRERRIVEM